MFAKVIADRYARAVLHDCPDLASIERAKNELDAFGDAYRASTEVRAFLLDPKMPPQVKISILRAGFSEKLGPQVLHLLMLLLVKRRQSILPDIADRYTELVDQVRGVEVAELVTAVEIDPELRNRLIESIQRFSTRDVEVNLKIDQSILGGVVVRLGDRLIDGSLKRRFQDIRRTMLAARLPRRIPAEE